MKATATILAWFVLAQIAALAANPVSLLLDPTTKLVVWPTNIGTLSKSQASNLTAGGASTDHYHAADRDRANHTGTQAWSTITGTPTTLVGYGITDSLQPLDSDLSVLAATAGASNLVKSVDFTLHYHSADRNRANHTGTQAWSTITGTPTTLAGYGITNAPTFDQLLDDAPTNSSFYGRLGGAWATPGTSDISGLQTALNGKQPTNSNLTTLGTLDGSGLTNLNASSLASGTVASGRLPSNLQTVNTLDGSGLTNLNASSLASGTVSTSRLPTSGVSAGLYTNATVVVDQYGRVTAATNGVGGGGGGSSPTTTRGDLIRRGASADERLALGDFGARLISDGTDAVWEDDTTTVIVDHMLGASTAGVWGQHGWTFTQGNSGSAGQNVGDTNYAGSVYLSTASSANANTSMATFNQSMLLGYGRYRERIRFQTPTNLIDGTDGYELRIGFIDTTTTTLPADGAFFQYVTNQANWQCVNASNSVYNTVDSGVAVAANTWYTGTIDVQESSRVVYTIGGVSVTNSLNLPLGSSRYTGLGALILKKSGTNAKALSVDWWKTYVKIP